MSFARFSFTTIFKWVFFSAILFFCAMQYWSSLLCEKQQQDMKAAIALLQKKIDSFQTREISSGFYPEATLQKTPQSVRSIFPNPQLPNLLEEDVYFKNALPKIFGAQFKSFGVRHSPIFGKPQHLHPFSNSKEVSTILELCSCSLGIPHVGVYEKFAPGSAEKIEERIGEDGSKQYWIFLRENLYWEPLSAHQFPQTLHLSPHFFQKHPVTAKDFKLYYDAVMNPHLSEPKAAALKNHYRDIEEVQVLDPLTLVIKWKKHPLSSGALAQKYCAFGTICCLYPLPEFVYCFFPDGTKIIDDDSDPDVYQHNSIWAQYFSNHWAKNYIVSCGPWIFEKIDDQGICLTKNKNFFLPTLAMCEKMVCPFKEGFEAMWNAFKAGQIDTCLMAPCLLSDLENFFKTPLYRNQVDSIGEILQLDYVEPSYTYIGWNERKFFFREHEIRKAMTLAIDRDRIIEEILNGMGEPLTGPFFPYSPSYDKTLKPYPYDLFQAKKILEEHGWIDRDGDGILDFALGNRLIPFRFTLTYYVKNITTKIICETIATNLKQIGIECRLKGVDSTDLSRSLEEKEFDAIFMGWSLTGPPENPRQLWHSSGALQKGSSNSIGFSNELADQLIESLDYEDTKAKRIELYHQLHALIHELQPYTFLYVPKRKLLYRSYIKNVFVPKDHPDLIPNGEISEPNLKLIYLEATPFLATRDVQENCR